MRNSHDELLKALEDNKLPIKVIKEGESNYDLITEVAPGMFGAKDLTIKTYSKDGDFIAIASERITFYINSLKMKNSNIEFIENFSQNDLSKPYCWDHEWVDCGFVFSKFVCKKCDKLKEY